MAGETNTTEAAAPETQERCPGEQGRMLQRGGKTQIEMRQEYYNRVSDQNIFSRSVMTVLKS
jgi:hypothetical protein